MSSFTVLLVIFVWFLNFGISWLNARACGLVWAETKAIGGWQRFMTWMGAIMSASGFTWCYLILLLLLGYYVQPTPGPGETPYLSIEAVQAGLSLGYLIIMPAILFSGVMIWIDSLVKAWRNRSAGNIAVAGWNTFAQIHNTYSAMKGMPEAWKSVSGFFSKGNSKDKGGLLILLIVIMAIIGGAVTTWGIINKYAGTRPLPQRANA